MFSLSGLFFGTTIPSIYEEVVRMIERLGVLVVIGECYLLNLMMTQW